MNSSDSEEETSRFRDAIDTSFFSDHMFNDTVKENKCIEKKSNRKISDDHRFKDISVSANMQKIIGEKISNIIDSKIEFVNNIDKCSDFKNSEFESNVKLFTDSLHAISDEYPNDIVYPKSKPKIKKRRFPNDTDVNKKDAISAACVSPEFVFDQNNTKHWKSRRKQKTFEYIKHNNNLLILKHQQINKCEFDK